VGNSPEILVASGIKKAIKVKVHIIGQFIVQTRFVCQFNIEGRVTSVNAQLLGDTIYCDPMEFSYTSRAPNITATFAVIWGGSKPLDNPDNIHIVIYRCRDMADNCGMCLALAKKYDCGWCQSSDRCEVKDQCERGSAIWLNRSQTCPNPEVTSFSPALGPWEGGTNITIQGINLGKTFQDIYTGVMIAGINCQPYEHLYIKTKQIVCKVDGPGTNEDRHGPVLVRVENYRGESKTHFNFVDPVITGISPKYGPKSGGTMLQITGKYMNAGSNIQAFIGDLPCRILSTDQNQALCITSASDKTEAKKLKMKFDKGDRYFEKELFEYVDDPIIESAESGVASQIKVPKGIPAGGIRISVTGKNLAYIQKPQMYVYYEKKMFISECTVQSNTSMICSSPVIEADETKLDADNPLKLEYGFRMDNVSGVQNLTLNKDFSPFLLFPNPVFVPFDKEVKYYKSEYLNINVRLVGCQKS
jgi:plexin A